MRVENKRRQERRQAFLKELPETKQASKRDARSVPIFLMRRGAKMGAITDGYLLLAE